MMLPFPPPPSFFPTVTAACIKRKGTNCMCNGSQQTAAPNSVGGEGRSQLDGKAESLGMKEGEESGKNNYSFDPSLSQKRYTTYYVPSEQTDPPPRSIP